MSVVENIRRNGWESCLQAVSARAPRRLSRPPGFISPMWRTMGAGVCHPRRAPRSLRPGTGNDMGTVVKICGITRLEDALASIRAGAHAIGFVFYRPSPRYITPAAAGAIVRTLPPFITTVGLFVDAPAEDVRATVAQVPVQLLQFHGAETPAYCRQFGRPYMKAVRMGPEVDLLQYARDYRDAKALLLDAYV